MNQPSEKEGMSNRAMKSGAAKRSHRKQVIIEAARGCFLQYGYDKTTLEDIAARAGLSRPLLYLQFRNKEEIFIETTRALYREQFENARAVLARSLDRRETLNLIYEELLLKPWTRIWKSPGSEDFLAACHRISPQLDREYEREACRLLQPLLGDKSVVEIFLLCIDGLYSDDPSPAVLRRRVRLLIERFL